MFFFPDKWLKQVLPDTVLDSLVTKSGGVKSSAYNVLTRTGIYNKRELKKSLKQLEADYAASIKNAPAEGMTKGERRAEIYGEPNLLKARMKNLAVYDEVQNLKEKNKGKKYKWLPSSAINADPLHQLLYGKVFDVGEGDNDGNMPGERYGCLCGMEILDDDEEE
jgi:hypothetical protein